MLQTLVQILSKRTLREFWARHPDSKAPLESWFAVVDEASWDGPADIRKLYNSVDFVGDNRVIFNIGGNKYRLIAHVAYRFHKVLIKFIGTHAEYDKIDPETV
jgi:mRNA interferase HigB